MTMLGQLNHSPMVQLLFISPPCAINLGKFCANSNQSNGKSNYERIYSNSSMMMTSIWNPYWPKRSEPAQPLLGILQNKLLGLEFTWGDIGPQRITWTKDGILIDSSARKVLQLNDGPLTSCAELRYIWKSSETGPGTLQFQKAKRDEQPVPINTVPDIPEVKQIPKLKEAVRRSFKQAISSDSFVALFRLKSKQENRFNGRIVGTKGSSEISWSQKNAQKNEDKLKIWTASFGHGNMTTNEETLNELISWATKEDRAEQWNAICPFLIDKLYPTCQRLKMREKSLIATQMGPAGYINEIRAHLGGQRLCKGAAGLSSQHYLTPGYMGMRF